MLEIVFCHVQTKTAACKKKEKKGVRGDKILNIASELPDTDLLHNMLALPE